MAHILPKDEELFKRIAREHIQVDPALWNAIYQNVGDVIIVINLLVRSYIDDNQEIPKTEAGKILEYTKRLISVIKKIDHPEAIAADEKDQFFRAIRDRGLRLDPVTHELFGNYVRNDINIINLVCINCVDPLDTRETMTIADARKILDHTRSTMRFLDRLREATSKSETF
ncbi:MAG: hypothetical protein WCG78_07205 [Candidatus Omnitrophota bacterium]